MVGSIQMTAIGSCGWKFIVKMLLISVTASCDRLGPYDTKSGPCQLSLVSATLFSTVQLHRDFAIGFEIYTVVVLEDMLIYCT